MEKLQNVYIIYDTLGSQVNLYMPYEIIYSTFHKLYGICLCLFSQQGFTSQQ